jgi:DNA topoisomerase-1
MSISTDKKLLVIVESPNKVSTITKILKDLGYSKAVVMASVGHTTKIKDNKKSYHNTGIYPDEDFRVDWTVDPDKKSIVEGLKAQAKNADLVLIASDPDREGESLGNHIKRLLKLNDSQYYRIKYHSVTKDEIQRALEHPEYMNTALCEAAESRQVVDKMIGYTLSPVAKAYLGARSVGRCQSAGLKLIVDREKEIRDFVPEYYYDLFVTFEKDGVEYKAKYIGTPETPIDKIKSTDLLLDIKAECEPTFTVSDIQKKKKKENPKPPFCTATFQQEAADKLGLKVKDAMSCAQKLFEGISINGEHTGLITYMRTDATDLAAEFLPSLQQYINNTYGETSYRAPKQAKKQQNAQEGHEALRVVDPDMTPERLATYIKNELLLKVYKLIWQRTVASAMSEAIYDEITYIINNQNHLFKLTTSNLCEPGYKVVYGDCNIKSDAPILKKNEILSNSSLQEVAKATQPPARYKEATLIKELQKQGIGRPSTYVTIVETVLSPTRNYCVIEGKEIIPTEKGMQLTSFLDRSFFEIINLDYTRQLEESLDAIATNKLSRTDFLSSFYQTLEQAIQTNRETAGEVMGLDTPTCPNCDSPMVIRRSRFGKLFYGCSNYPTCNGIVSIQ